MSYWHIPLQFMDVFDRMDGYYTTTTESTYSDSETDSLTEFDPLYDSDDESILSEHRYYRMYISNREYLDEEDKTHLRYYLGSASLINEKWLLETAISPQLFFSHSYKRICNYLKNFSVHSRAQKTVSILQLHIEDIENTPWTCYYVINKTFWIRLIQRHWRKICKRNKMIINGRKCPRNQYFRQIRGKYPIGYNQLYGLHGLLAQYNWRAPQ